jgi:hypothetical protein
MNRRTWLTTMALLCFTVALPAGDAAGQQQTLKDRLAGLWTYASSEITLPNGTKQPSVFGANPKGILILDAGGRYADIEMRPDRPKFKASGNFRVNTPAAEWGEARWHSAPTLVRGRSTRRTRPSPGDSRGLLPQTMRGSRRKTPSAWLGMSSSLSGPFRATCQPKCCAAPSSRLDTTKSIKSKRFRSTSAGRVVLARTICSQPAKAEGLPNSKRW